MANILTPYTIELYSIMRLAIALLFVIAAVCCDLKLRKVPNKLTFPMIALGIAMNAVFSPARLIESFVLMALCIALALLPGIGMGDVKLLMGLGFFLKPVHVALELGVASVILVVVQFIRNPHQTGWLVFTRRLRPLTKTEAAAKSETNSVPFAPYLLAAVILIEGIALGCGIYIACA